jgi:hypothetical protein
MITVDPATRPRDMNRLSRCVLLTTLWLGLPVAAAGAADIGPAIRVVRDIAYSAAPAEPGQTLDLYLSEQEPSER